MVGLEIVSAGKDHFCLTCNFTADAGTKQYIRSVTVSFSSFFSPFLSDDGFNKKQRHLKAQAFAIKMRPRKETLEVNFVSASFDCVCHGSGCISGKLRA